MTLQELVLIRGLPGAGKTTYAKKHYPKHIYYDADMFCIDSNGKYKFVPELTYKSHDMCKTKIKESLQDGYNVVVANVFATKRDICGYISYISSNIKIDIIHINGMFQSIHNVPNHTINRIKCKWEQYPGETEIYFDNELKKVDLPKDIIKNKQDVIMTEQTSEIKDVITIKDAFDLFAKKRLDSRVLPIQVTKIEERDDKLNEDLETLQKENDELKLRLEKNDVNTSSLISQIEKLKLRLDKNELDKNELVSKVEKLKLLFIDTLRGKGIDESDLKIYIVLLSMW